MLSEQGRALAYCCACKDAGQPIDPDQTVKAFFKGMLLAWCSLAIASLGGAVLLLVIGSVVAPYTLVKGAWDFSEGRTWSGLLEMVLGALGIVMVYSAAAEMDAAIRQYDDIIKEYDRQHGGDGSSGNNNAFLLEVEKELVEPTLGLVHIEEKMAGVVCRHRSTRRIQ